MNVLMKCPTEAGYKAILVSVDTPLLGRRLNEHRNEFTLPEDMGWPNLLSDGKKELTGRSSAEDNDTDFGQYRSNRTD